MQIHPGWPNRRVMRRRVIALATALWLAGLAAGGVAYWRFASEPGQIAPTPAQWPASSQLGIAPVASVVMFAHPDCPCTTASLTELREALRDVRETRAIVVMAYDSDELRARIARLPGVRVHVDNGHEAALFGATTSGFTVAYDARGTLLYAGGITGSRGHAGANVGRRSLHAALVGAAPTHARHDTYGCSLEDR